MSNYTFDGTSLSYSSGVDKITDIKFSEDGNPIDITGLSDTKHLFANGKTTEECEITVLGVTSITIGSTDALTITWPDASTETITNSLVTNVERGGSLDGELTSTISIRRSADEA